MRPRLVVNPSSDAVFVAYAQLIADHGVTSAAEFEQRLRPVFPRAVVHARLLSGEPILILYVYRDGQWVHPGTVDDAIEGGDPDAQPE
jgi:hypothetical protein